MTIKDKLEMYRNYLVTLEYHKEYGDKYGDTEELIKTYEKILQIKKNNPTKTKSNKRV